MQFVIDKWKQLNKAVKASIAFFFASIISAGMSYITVPIYTRLMSSAEFGEVSLYTTWMSVIGTIAMFSLHCGVFNNGMIDYKEDRDGYSLSMLVLSNCITVIVAALFIGLYPIIGKIVGIDCSLLTVMFVSFLFQPAYNFYIARKRYEYEYKSTFAVSVLAAVLAPMITVTLMLTTDYDRLYVRILGTEFTLIALYFGFYLYLFVKGRCRVKIQYWLEAVKFNLPLIPHYLSSYLLGSSAKIMIAYLVSDEATAYFSIAFSVASIGTIVWSAINGSLIPYTYEKCKEKNYKAISNVTIPIMMVFAVILVIVILFAPEVVAIMATPEYMEAIYAIPPIIGGVFFQVSYYIYANIVYYYKKSKYVMYASVLSVIINIALNYLLIPLFGYLVAGYTMLVSYLLQSALDYWAMKKVVKDDVYDMKIVGILSTTVIVVALVSNVLYSSILIRYILLVVIGALAIISRKKIKKLLFELKK